MQWFLDAFRPDAQTSILDLGGTPEFWEGAGLRVTLLNPTTPADLPDNFTYVEADATEIPFDDGAFDIVFSNSMIEHLGTRERQQEAAREARRVGRALWIQTPNLWFPIEPHYLTPFVHWIPPDARRRVLRNGSVWGLVMRPSREYVDRIVDEIHLLSAADLGQLFPDCQIWRERSIGLTKSLIAVRLPVRGDPEDC